jgi:hypothetical protein
MLLDRFDIRFIDELADEVKRGGAPSLEENIDMILESIPKDLSQDEREDASQRAMYAEILRYQKEVEEPAAAILRERKASQPGAVKKVEVALCGADNDAHFYRELLEGIEPELEVAEAPGVSSLTLRVSWAPGFPFRGLQFSGFISSCHNNIMVLYVGPGRPCSCLPWCTIPGPAPSPSSHSCHPGLLTCYPMPTLGRGSPSFATLRHMTTCLLSFSSVEKKKKKAAAPPTRPNCSCGGPLAAMRAGGFRRR